MWTSFRTGISSAGITRITESSKRSRLQPGRVVFLGDSITDGWDLNRDFPGKPYVNRGISGQTTPQMLVRMFPDVIDLHPAALILLAGTNDISGNTGPETLKMIEENIQAITELAEKHGIKVILCSVMPVSDYTKNKQTVHRPPTDILKLNAWLRSFADEAHAVFADYYSAMVDAQGMLKEGFSRRRPASQRQGLRAGGASGASSHRQSAHGNQSLIHWRH